jgi:hypothetical protein
MALGTKRRYRLGGDLAFRDVDGNGQHLTKGTELGPKVMANFNAREIAIHVSTGLFVPVEPDRQGPASRLRSIIVRTS